MRHTTTVGGCTSFHFRTEGRISLPFEFHYKEGCPMVTYEALFQYTLVIIGIITLVITVNKKK
ncbi:hypothetical protein [Butyricicoccus sp.]|uniref:hypothetical protein n=1 Tax=Butyricicoccus sp. TaxID=2049021 RepID=UPI003F189DBA